MASLGMYMFPVLTNLLPVWDTRGFIAVMILHMAVSEPLYYYLHKCFHGNYLFNHYHSLHHSSPVPQPFTGNYLSQLKPISPLYLIFYPADISIFASTYLHLFLYI